MAPGGTSGKESACNAGDATDTGPIPGSGRSPGGGMATHVSILPGKLHGQRSPVGYSPWSHQVSDMTAHTPTLLWQFCV